MKAYIKTKVKIILLPVLLCILCSACGRHTVSEEYVSAYTAERIQLPDDGQQASLLGMACGDGRLAFIRHGSVTEVYEIETDSAQIRLAETQSEDVESACWDLAYDKNNNLYILWAGKDRAAFWIDIVPSDGEDVRRLDVTEPMQQYLSDGVLDGAALKTDGNFIYLLGLYHTVVMNQDGEVLYTDVDEMNGQYWYQETDGTLVLLRWNAKKRWDCYVYSRDEAEPVKRDTFPIQDFEKVMDGGYGYDYYYICRNMENGSGENIVGVKDGGEYLLCRIDDAGLDSSRCANSIQACSEGTFVCLYSERVGQTSAMMLKKNDQMTEAVQERTQLNLVGINLDQNIKNAVTHFNAQQSDIHVNMIDYTGMYSDYDEALRQLNLKLTQKGEADIICLRGLAIHSYMEKDMLVDFNSFFTDSGQDGGLKKEDLLSPVLDACTAPDGGIYYLYPEFYLHTFMQKGAGENMLSPDYIRSENEKLKAGQLLFSEADKLSTLYDMLLYNPEQMISYEDKTSHFDCTYFREILELIKEMPQADGETASLPELVRGDKVIFFNGEIEMLLDYMLFTQMCEGDVAFLGYPTEKGNAVVMDCMEGGLGILSTSARQEEAWRFLSFLFDEKEYDSMFGIYYLPVRKDSMNTVIEKMSAAEGYTREDGEKVLPVSEYQVGYEDYVITPEPLTQADVETFQNLLESAVSCDKIEEKYMDIILEEASSYFAGQQDVDTTILHIEKRVGTALKE